ncbi:MAG TPA: alpha/beta fold hydrolase [Flavisolibacter sp.]|nr:alpha/beta fold hydrolase [Flavisolibacter sp.]
MFLFQEQFIFFPEKLRSDYKFTFTNDFEEIYITCRDGTLLHGLLFTSKNSKGLIYYLHGNAGSLKTWGDVANTYTDLNYDVFILDYRGYGKSAGSISSEEQLYVDIQTAYTEMKKRYNENKIIILGYSIGTGPAAKTASVNQPRLLILQAPYYSLTDLMKQLYPVLPTFILKYKFENYKYLQGCKMPVVIFHGDADEIIPYKSAIKLNEVLKSTDRFITLQRQSHNGMTENPEYLTELKALLQ